MLKSQLQRATGSPPDEPAASPEEPLLAVEETEEWFEIQKDKVTGSDDVHIFHAPNAGSVGTADDFVPCDTKSVTGNRKVKAQFGRRRTHNEQLLVRPCGVIFARATFFGAEAVSNVLVSLVRYFLLTQC